MSEEDLGAASAHLEAETKSRPSNRHTNLNWLNNTRSNYKKVVVSKCSEQTRQAVAGNEKLKVTFIPTWLMLDIFLTKDPKKKNIRDELINTTIDLLGTICGGVGTPSIIPLFLLRIISWILITELKEMIEIAGTMAVVYPNMFGTVEHDGDDDHEGNVEKEGKT